MFQFNRDVKLDDVITVPRTTERSFYGYFRSLKLIKTDPWYIKAKVYFKYVFIIVYIMLIYYAVIIIFERISII
jgi:hypothetical protein